MSELHVPNKSEIVSSLEMKTTYQSQHCRHGALQISIVLFVSSILNYITVQLAAVFYYIFTSIHLTYLAYSSNFCLVIKHITLTNFPICGLSLSEQGCHCQNSHSFKRKKKKNQEDDSMATTCASIICSSHVKPLVLIFSPQEAWFPKTYLRAPRGKS